MKKKSLILIPFASLFLSGCVFTPNQPTTSVPPTTQPTSETSGSASVDPTTSEQPTTIQPTSGSTSEQPTSGSIDPTSGTTTPTSSGTSTTSEVPPVVHTGLTEEDAFTPTEACTKAQEFKGVYSPDNYYIKGEVTFVKQDFDSQYGSLTFNLGDFVCFRLKNGPEHNKFTAQNEIEAGDTVTVCGMLTLYGEEETPEMTYSYNKGVEGYVLRIVKGGEPVGPVHVSSVSLDKKLASIKTDGSIKLNATVLPDNADNKNVTWSSSNTSVATVSSSGLVSGVAEGEATITVRAEDGGKYDTCVVTVTNGEIPPVAVTSVSLDKTSASIKDNGSVQLTATVLPSDAANKNVTWSSSNTSAATVSPSGLVSGVAEGNATITVTTEDGGKTAQCVITVTKSDVPPTPGQTISWTFGETGLGSEYPGAAAESPEDLSKVYSEPSGISFGSSEKAYPLANKALKIGSNSGAGHVDFATIGAITKIELTVDSTKGAVTVTAGGETITGEGGVYVISKDDVKSFTIAKADGAIKASYINSMIVTIGEGGEPVGPVAVTGVTLDKTTATVKTSETVKLTATVAPSNANNKNVTWSSSNESIATVSSTGLVSGIAEGTATITVTTQDGGKTAQCIVTVTNGEIPPVPPTPGKTIQIVFGDEVNTNPSGGAQKTNADLAKMYALPDGASFGPTETERAFGQSSCCLKLGSGSGVGTVYITCTSTIASVSLTYAKEQGVVSIDGVAGSNGTASKDIGGNTFNVSGKKAYIYQITITLA